MCNMYFYFCAVTAVLQEAPPYTPCLCVFLFVLVDAVSQSEEGRKQSTLGFVSGAEENGAPWLCHLHSRWCRCS